MEKSLEFYVCFNLIQNLSIYNSLHYEILITSWHLDVSFELFQNFENGRKFGKSLAEDVGHVVAYWQAMKFEVYFVV